MAARKKIIVAEDEPLVRMLAVEVLVEAGFDVIEAAHADEALAHLHGHEGKVSLLFTDVHMPGSALNGLELAHVVRKTWPNVALLITSAIYVTRANELPSDSRFVSKPYELGKLVRHAHQLTTD